MTTALSCKLDWLSFTFPITLLGENDNEYTLTHILSAFHDHTGQRLLPVVTRTLWTWVQSAGFYSHKIQCPKSLIAISWSAGNPHALCEISGQAIDVVLQAFSVPELAASANGRATRVDLAVDIETRETPETFTALRNDSSFRAYAIYKTETGETVYVGSRKSDRMARVYRYNPPHPRSHLLRVEIECKGDFVKNVCTELLTSSLTSVCASVNAPFGWSHPIWDLGSMEVSKIPARAYDSEGAGTLRWLNRTVVPAIKKASQQGLIDLRQWLQDNFDIDVPE